MDQKSPDMLVMEWLYEHKYDHIHQEWYAEKGNRIYYDFPIIPWLKEKYPEIWKEYERK